MFSWRCSVKDSRYFCWYIHCSSCHGLVPLFIWITLHVGTLQGKKEVEHPSSTPVSSGVRVTWYFMCMVCRSLFVLLYFYFWPLSCLFFFDLRILITPLISSNYSYSAQKTESHNIFTQREKLQLCSKVIFNLFIRCTIVILPKVQ